MVAKEADSIVSQLDEDLPVFDHGGIGPDRDHARPPTHRSGFDVELSAMKIAFDDVAVDEALRQRSGPMRAVIVGDEELAVDIEDRERQIVALDLQHGPNLDVGRVA